MASMNRREVSSGHTIHQTPDRTTDIAIEAHRTAGNHRGDFIAISRPSTRHKPMSGQQFVRSFTRSLTSRTSAGGFPIASTASKNRSASRAGAAYSRRRKAECRCHSGHNSQPVSATFASMAKINDPTNRDRLAFESFIRTTLLKVSRPGTLFESVLDSFS